MKIGYFTVNGEGCFNEISDLLSSELNRPFRTDIINGVIFFIEQFSMTSSSNLMTVVRIQKLKNSEHHCEIEIVAGGGGDTIFAITLGNEKRRRNKIFNLITDFCNHKKYITSDLVKK